jgi:hypothetical protein
LRVHAEAKGVKTSTLDLRTPYRPPWCPDHAIYRARGGAEIGQRPETAINAWHRCLRGSGRSRGAAPLLDGPDIPRLRPECSREAVPQRDLVVGIVREVIGGAGEVSEDREPRFGSAAARSKRLRMLQNSWLRQRRRAPRHAGARHGPSGSLDRRLRANLLGPLAGVTPQPSGARRELGRFRGAEHLARWDGSPKGRDRPPVVGICRARLATARPATPDAPDDGCRNQNSAAAAPSHSRSISRMRRS